jgi:3-oxoacyl-[acyl-carrier protein] reductase
MSSVAIVTGASHGIGRATAICLIRSFKFIVLVARNAEKLEETSKQVISHGSRALSIAADLSDPSSAETIVFRTLQEFERIDALVNISGAVSQIDLFEMTDEQWDDGLAVKFHSARRLTLPCLGRTENLPRLRDLHVRKFSSDAQGTLRSCRSNQRRYCRARKSVL